MLSTGRVLAALLLLLVVRGAPSAIAHPIFAVAGPGGPVVFIPPAPFSPGCGFSPFFVAPPVVFFGCSFGPPLGRHCPGEWTTDLRWRATEPHVHGFTLH